MATLDEYITTFFSDIKVADGPSGYPNVITNPAPPAAFVESEKVVDVVEKSTALGQRSLIPVTVPTGEETRTVIGNTDLPRTDESALDRIINANLQAPDTILSTEPSQTFFDARDEAVISEINRPVAVTDFAAVKVEESIDSTDLIQNVDLELVQLNQRQETSVLNLSAQVLDQDEVVESPDLQDSVLRVSQLIAPEAILLTQTFSAAFTAQLEDTQLELSSVLPTNLTPEQQIAESFIFDPNTALFQSPDESFTSVEASTASVQQATKVIESGGNAQPPPPSFSDSGGYDGGSSFGSDFGFGGGFDFGGGGG